MMKKVLLVFITAASLLFYSCGSKKAEEKPAPQVPELSDIQRENDVQTDDVQQEQQIADEQEQQTESSSSRLSISTS